MSTTKQIRYGTQITPVVQCRVRLVLHDDLLHRRLPRSPPPQQNRCHPVPALRSHLLYKSLSICAALSWMQH
jgi:hypothetical protein